MMKSKVLRYTVKFLIATLSLILPHIVVFLQIMGGLKH